MASLAHRRWTLTSLAMMGIGGLSAAPVALVVFVAAMAWCADHRWPQLASVPIAAAACGSLAWWWHGPHRQRELLRTFAEPLPSVAWPRVAQVLGEVREKTGFKRPLEIWFLPRRTTHAFVVGSRHLVLTAGLIGEPPQLQAAVIAHELGHLQLGHSSATWLVERCFIGYDTLVEDVVGNEARSRWIPGSLAAAVIVLGELSFLALPLLALRLLGTALGRRMEWEADRFAYQFGYGEYLDVALSRLAKESNRPADVGMLIWHVPAQTHPPTSERQFALRTGGSRRRSWRERLIRVALRVARTTKRVTGGFSRDVVSPPIDCGTIFVAGLLADLGALQSLLNKTAWLGTPLLIPLMLVTLRGRPRRPIKRARTLRLGLLLMLAAHGVVTAAPAALNSEATAESVDLMMSAGLLGVLLGVGTRAWLRVAGKTFAVFVLPGYYAMRILDRERRRRVD
jgi:Zn-dependent protease with chaperone function